jgi:aspartyl-tRNA(Asn)/glutamyl-tRNA(Gln) amidotransferase subunit B
MEKGNMRCDVNISLRPEGQKELGTKIELKNINSMSAIRRAIKFETERQADILDSGGQLQQSTLRWDDDRGETTLMRSKEDAHDYRYFPDPDLLPVRTVELVAKMRSQVPELPHEKRARFEKDYGCSAYDASVLASEKELALWYEAAVAADTQVPAKKMANWVINDLLGALNDRSLTLADCPVKPEALSSLVATIEGGKISNNQGKEVFVEMFETGKPAAEIIKAKGFEQVSDTGALEAIVEQILAANPDKVAEVKGGNEKAMNWFTGQAMKASQGKANPKMVTEIVRKKVLG